MKRIIFAWELGGGFGHLAPFLPIARLLAKQRVEVVFAVRDTLRVSTILGKQHQSAFQFLQAPLLDRPSVTRFPRPTKLSEVLANVGYEDHRGLRDAVKRWHALFQQVKPELIVADHAPGALLAARTWKPAMERRTATALFGTGFVNPASSLALIDSQELETHISDEVVNAMNRVLEAFQVAALDEMHDLYRGHNWQWLTTYQELDHDPHRIDGNYVGTWDSMRNRESMSWPQGNRPRILAYLKTSKGLGHLFDWLKHSELSSIVICDGFDAQKMQRLASVNLRFLPSPVPIARLSADCDIAINNANHNTTCNFLRQGKPTLLLPLNLEQRVTADRVVSLGAGLDASADDGVQIVWQLANLIASAEAKCAAKRFADQYRAVDALEIQHQILDQIFKT